MFEKSGNCKEEGRCIVKSTKKCIAFTCVRRITALLTRGITLRLRQLCTFPHLSPLALGPHFSAELASSLVNDFSLTLCESQSSRNFY